MGELENGVKRAVLKRTYPSFTLSYRRTVKRITVPVLLMAGTHDLIKESHTRFIAKCIPDSQLVLIKGGTHQGFFKKKELYTGAISEFLFDKKKLDKTNNIIKN